MNNLHSQDLIARTRNFALATLRLCAELPRSTEIGLTRRHLSRRQLPSRPPSQVASRYRCQALDRRGEADECIYWLELLQDLVKPHSSQLRPLQSEADQLVAIIVASKKTAKQKGL
ncbi:MAG TPA: four helix bundle protein [Acidobacteriota bacterium]|nr:four helix bundle protein [Acidobacteriota bacterium]